MKSRISKIFAILAVVAIFGGIFAISKTVLAEEISKEPSPVQLEKLTLGCDKIKTHFKKLRNIDVQKRLSLGREYENISNELMGRLNVAAVSKKLSSTEILNLSREFDDNFSRFKENYRNYEQSLAQLMESDCGNAPEFYAQIENSRKLRKEVDSNAKRLAEISKEYLEAAKKLESEVK